MGNCRHTPGGKIGVALHLLYAMLCVESDRHKKGGREATATRGAALEMHWLIEQKSVDDWVAAQTVLPHGTDKDVEAACKMYEKMKNANEFDALVHKLDPAYMETLAKLLPKRPIRNE